MAQVNLNAKRGAKIFSCEAAAVDVVTKPEKSLTTQLIKCNLPQAHDDRLPHSVAAILFPIYEVSKSVCEPDVFPQVNDYDLPMTTLMSKDPNPHLD